MPSNKKPSPKRGKGYSDHQRDQVDAGPESKISHSEHSEPKPGTADQKADSPTPEGYEKAIARWTAIVGAFTIVLAIATIASAWILWKTDETLKETMVNGQRAYVGLSTTYGIKATTGSINLLVENDGQTPAKNVKVFANWEFVPLGENLPPEFSFPEKSGCDATIKSVGPVFPRNPQLTSNRVCGTDLGNVTLAEQGAKSAFVYGHISYLDIFDKYRTTTFCFLYGGRIANPTGSTLCDRHNEIDPE